MSAYWEIRTSFTIRPIKLLLDTGAQITIIANDIILRNSPLNQFIISLTGITGIEHAITTLGSTYGNLITENETEWPLEAHLVDRKHAGQYDGYLGFDFMINYGAIINFRNNTMQLHSGAGNELEENDENRKIMPMLFLNENTNEQIYEMESNSDANLQECIAGDAFPSDLISML